MRIFAALQCPGAKSLPPHPATTHEHDSRHAPVPGLDLSKIHVDFIRDFQGSGCKSPRNNDEEEKGKKKKKIEEEEEEEEEDKEEFLWQVLVGLRPAAALLATGMAAGESRQVDTHIFVCTCVYVDTHIFVTTRIYIYMYVYISISILDAYIDICRYM